MASEPVPLLSRSPRPYRRIGQAIAARNNVPDFRRDSKTSSAATSTTSFASRPRLGLHAPTSDSGTEADDESFKLLKSLPAPPPKSRKGLRDSRGTGGLDDSSSPLITPSILDSIWRDSFFASTSPNSVNVHNLLQKRRAELARRIVECLLLFVIARATLSNQQVFVAVGQWRREILCHIIIVSSLLFGYIFNLVRHVMRSKQLHNLPFWHRVRLPLSVDPGPILYPIFVPVLVAMALLPANMGYLMPNLILSLASIPPRLIPFFDNVPGLQCSRWMLSVLPLLVSENTTWTLSSQISKPYKLRSGMTMAVMPETLLLLHPLHEALLATLRHLTTTSLLATELELLSTSLINLLLFARSPQAVILQALLWNGGYLLLVVCRHALKWTVALARVPSWRFRRAEQLARTSHTYLCNPSSRSSGKCSTQELLRRQTENLQFNDSDESSSSSPSSSASSSLLSSSPPQQRLSVYGDKELEFSYEEREASLPESRYFDGIAEPPPRRHTFPLEGEQSQQAQSPSLPKPAKRRKRRRRAISGDIQALLCLTPRQAYVRKWGYALYVYAATLLVIAIPVRKYAAQHALHGREPIGWALGFLFGDISLFRSFVESWDELRSWIYLPVDVGSDTRSLGRVDRFRTRLGSCTTRLLVACYCLVICVAGISLVVRVAARVEVDTRRKIFHGMMVLMFLPMTFVDPAFVAFAFALTLAVFLLVDLFRASQLPPIARPLTNFLAPYVDGRDHKGPVIVSHIFLLIGCAIPLWLSLAGIPRVDVGAWRGWEMAVREISMVSGVVCVGMGDAAASLFGRRFGRRKWPWSGGKSIEGSLAFAVAVMLGLCTAKVLLLAGGWSLIEKEQNTFRDLFVSLWGLKAGAAAVAASLMEAVMTGGNDNVIVPIVLWLLVKGLNI